MRWLLSTREVEGVTIVDILESSIYLGETYRDLRDAIKEILGKGAKKILINLAKVRIIDSTGIGDLIACYTSAKSQSAKLKLLTPQTRVKDLLVITRLATIFEIFYEEKEAIESFRT